MDRITHLGRESIEQGSRSFAAAARLFPAATRDSASMLYASCRYCDDLIDGQQMGFAGGDTGGQPLASRLRSLEERLHRALGGEVADDPVFEGFQRVLRRHAIPAPYVEDLLEGFRMDVEGHQYRRIDDTLRYCYHVAGVIGVMMAMVMGVRDPPTLDRACDLGIAFQLTNISRDVLDDAAMGRCYLPEDWLAAEGIAADCLTLPAHRQALARVTARLLDCAEPYYGSAAAGLPALTFRNAWAIATARGVYRDIGLRVRRCGENAWDQRLHTGQGRKLYWLLCGGAQAAYAATLGQLGRARPRQALWNRPQHRGEDCRFSVAADAATPGPDGCSP